MLVIDLINRLKRMDPKQEVYFAHPSHDYWRHELASPVEAAEVEAIKFSAYHDQMATVDREDEDKDDDEQNLVVVLR